ncbi:MAG: hypothetical protein HY791_38490 [Deltaproteobacteria bacterium]|nr:hypothetical protein [Deltaproteobacteria bacterium]
MSDDTKKDPKEKYKNVSYWKEAGAPDPSDLSDEELDEVAGGSRWDYCSNGCPTHCMGWNTWKY